MDMYQEFIDALTDDIEIVIKSLEDVKQAYEVLLTIAKKHNIRYNKNLSCLEEAIKLLQDLPTDSSDLHRRITQKLQGFWVYEVEEEDRGFLY